MGHEWMNEQAMQMIVKAGEAIQIIQQCMVHMEEEKIDTDKIDKWLEAANEHLIEAHSIQREVIQASLEDEKQGITVLMTHAQDTLMTTKSELRMVRMMSRILAQKQN